MKKSKLTLGTLKVKSFITTNEMKNLRGGDPDSYNDDDSDGERCHKHTKALCDTYNNCPTENCRFPTQECETLQGCNSRTIP